MQTRQFQDEQGRPWVVMVDVNALRRVREMTGIDLLKIADNRKDETNLVFRLMTDPVLTVDVLYAVLKPACEAAGVEPEDFGAAIAGDTFLDAHDTLMQATIDFFPSQKRRALQTVLAKIHELERRMESRALEVIEGGELDKLIEAEMNRPILPSV